MPGIFGIVATNDSLQKCPLEHRLSRMAQVLTHQSLYRLTTYVDQHVALGALAIGGSAVLEQIDCAEGKYVVMIDGYIYSIAGQRIENLSLVPRKVLDHVLDHKVEMAKIAGNYCVAIYDIPNRSFQLFNDRMGPRRLYFSIFNEGLMFSPEIKGISTQPQFEKRINWSGVADLLNYGYLLGEKTLFEGIRSLSSGTTLYTGNREGVHVEKYTCPRYQDSGDGFDAVIEKGLSLLSASVREKLDYSESVICPISGGLDSRLILSIISKLDTGVPVKPVTYGQTFSYEYKNAAKVCAKLGYGNHDLVTIDGERLLDKYRQSVWLSEGMVPMTNCHLLLMPEALGNGYRQLLNGIYGGPTNYAAEYYRHDHIDFRGDEQDKINDIVHVLALKSEPYTGILPELSPGLRERSVENVAEEFGKFLGVSDRFCDQRDAFFIENRMRRFINQMSLYRFFWEEHLPLSNYDLYDFYLSTSPEYKLDRKILKQMILVGFPQMARIKDANTGLSISGKPGGLHKVKTRLNSNFRYYVNRYGKGKVFLYDKSTYAHYDVWFRRRKNYQFFADALRTSSLLKNGIFDTRRFFQLFDSVKGGGGGFHHLYRLMTFALWYELFVDESGVGVLSDDMMESFFQQV